MFWKGLRNNLLYQSLKCSHIDRPDGKMCELKDFCTLQVDTLQHTLVPIRLMISMMSEWSWFVAESRRPCILSLHCVEWSPVAWTASRTVSICNSSGRRLKLRRTYSRSFIATHIYKEGNRETWKNLDRSRSEWCFNNWIHVWTSMHGAKCKAFNYS